MKSFLICPQQTGEPAKLGMMGCAFVIHEGEKKCMQGFGGKTKYSHCLEDLYLEGKGALKWFLNRMAGHGLN